jgi:hypothetical protein
MYIIVLNGSMAIATFVRVVGVADCIGVGGFLTPVLIRLRPCSQTL